MSEAKRVELYYDVISPYSWIEFEILCRYRSQWNIKVEFCPMLLAGVMKATGNRPPGSVSAKATYYGKDLGRLAKYCQIPIQIPKNVPEVMFQKGSLSAQRFLAAAMTECPDKLEEISRQLWMRVWSRDEDITERSSLMEAGLKAGLSEDTVSKMADVIACEDIKLKLRELTQEAIDLGCFGAPFIVVHMEDGRKETFFGSDRMELMAHIIENRSPAMVPAKGEYGTDDIMRLRDYYQIPLNQPKNLAEVLFQKGSLKAQRFLIAAEQECPGKVEEFSRQLWMRVWSRDEDITEVSSLREAGVKAGIHDDILDKMETLILTDTVKDKLKLRTQEALDLGCFGAPFIVVHLENGRKERFFGSDRMEIIAHIIGEKWEGPLNQFKAHL